jgi:hypothetical protein
VIEQVRILMNRNQLRTARAYRSVYNDLMAFTGGQDMYLHQIEAPFLRRYEQYMKDAGKSLNTMSFYMRNLRAIFYKGMPDKKFLQPANDPFKSVYMSSLAKPNKPKVEMLEATEYFEDFNIKNVREASIRISKMLSNTSFLKSDRKNT